VDRLGAQLRTCEGEGTAVARLRQIRQTSKHLDLKRLCEAMKRARLFMARAREERVKMIRQYVGQHWSEEGTTEKVPVNLVGQYVSIVGRRLVAKNPRVLISTFDTQLKPMVSAMTDWANKQIKHVKLQETLRRAVTDALFSVGIVKIALASPAEAGVYAWQLASGEPFAKCVDLDDFVYDIHARTFEEVGYIGHRFRVPLDIVKDSKYYTKSRRLLEPQEDKFFNQEGDERANVLGRGYYSNQEEYEDMIDLWEVYLPRHRQVVTLADDYLVGSTVVDDEPLRVQNWVGSPLGPYRTLGLGLVPANAMPKAPLQDLIDLHDSVNRVFRKLIRSLDRLKEIGLVQNGATEQGTRIMNANDGDIIQVDDPKNFAQVVMNAQHARTLFGMSEGFRDLFSWLGGGLELMGGLGPQSKTASQDQLLNQNSGTAIADMQESTVNFASEVITALLWYWWHDPVKIQHSVHALPGMPEFTINRQVTPAMRKQGKFEDLSLAVDPYSMAHQTPQTRMQALMQIMQQVIIPLMPILVQQGLKLDLNAFLMKVANFMDMPDLLDVVTIAAPPTQGPSGASQGGTPNAGLRTQPTDTNRTYTRQNVPARTPQGDRMNRINSLLGVDTGNSNGVLQGAQ